MPLVSAIIPTKGRPELVAKAIASVLAQTIVDLEVIVIVDGEDPATVARLQSITDPRLRYHLNDSSVGPGKARNFGAELATGKWLGFLDDDDEWLPTKLENQLLTATASSNRVLVTCHSAYITPHGTSVRPRDIYDGQTSVDEWLFDRRQMMGGGSFIQTSSFFMAKSVFQECGGFPDHGQHEDWEMVISAAVRHGVLLVTTPEILVRHYAEQDRPSLTASGRLERSIEWIQSMRGMISKRAFSGFCLTVVAQQAKRDGGWPQFAKLLKLAFRYGRPTPTQLLVFLAVWGMPPQLHSFLRRLRHRPQPVVAV